MLGLTGMHACATEWLEIGSTEEGDATQLQPFHPRSQLFLLLKALTYYALISERERRHRIPVPLNHYLRNLLVHRPRRCSCSKCERWSGWPQGVQLAAVAADKRPLSRTFDVLFLFCSL